MADRSFRITSTKEGKLWWSDQDYKEARIDFQEPDYSWVSRYDLPPRELNPNTIHIYRNGEALHCLRPARRECPHSRSVKPTPISEVQHTHAYWRDDAKQLRNLKSTAEPHGLLPVFWCRVAASKAGHSPAEVSHTSYIMRLAVSNETPPAIRCCDLEALS